MKKYWLLVELIISSLNNLSFAILFTKTKIKYIICNVSHSVPQKQVCKYGNPLLCRNFANKEKFKEREKCN
jgi:hypothetical protein